MIKNRKKVRVGQTVWLSVISASGRPRHKPSAHMVEKVDHHHIYFKEIGTARKFFIHKHYLAEFLNKGHGRGSMGIFTTYRRCLADCQTRLKDLQLIADNIPMDKDNWLRVKLMETPFISKEAERDFYNAWTGQ